MRRLLRNFLFFCFFNLLLSSSFSSNLINPVTNHFPKFEGKVVKSEEIDIDDAKNDIGAVSVAKACQRRFRSYSDVDFDERTRHDNLFHRHKKVLYRSFYEFVRGGIVRDSLVFVASLAEGRIKIPLIKYWLMLDKLLKDQAVHNSDSLIEFARLVIDMTPEIPGFIDQELYQIKLQTLRHAIKLGRPLQIIKGLLSNLANQIYPSDTKSIFELICISAKNFKTGQVLPIEFPIYQAAIEILNPLPWFVYIYNEGFEDDFLPWLLLSPFYLLFSQETNEFVLNGLKVILRNCVFDYDYDNIEVLSEFMRITNFCYCPENHGSLYRKKSEILSFLMERFEITGNCEDFLIMAIENNSIGLVEAFLRFKQNLLETSESRGKAIRICFSSSFPEMTMIIAAYCSITSDELETIWRATSKHLLVHMNKSIYFSAKFLLQICEEFDGDAADCDEIVKGDRIEHGFPQPSDYERYARKIISSSGLSVFYIARIILLKYFGIPFSYTRVQTDWDDIPIWLEIANTVNFFLDFLESKHSVIYTEPLVGK